MPRCALPCMWLPQRRRAAPLPCWRCAAGSWNLRVSDRYGSITYSATAIPAPPTPHSCADCALFLFNSMMKNKEMEQRPLRLLPFQFSASDSNAHECDTLTTFLCKGILIINTTATFYFITITQIKRNRYKEKKGVPPISILQGKVPPLKSPRKVLFLRPHSHEYER